MAKYLLIDGKNLLFRAGFASRNLKTSDGRYSGAIHGFIKMLGRVRKQHPDTEIVVLWEQVAQKTYRHKLFPGYKDRAKNGEPMDASTSGIHAQIDAVKAVCRAIGLRWVELPCIEADDIAGLLSVTLSKQGHEILLLSGDRDWWQLATLPNVIVLCEQGKGKSEPQLTDERVFETFACKAKELVRFRPFIGDTSDKIPPIKPRFHQKKALELVRAGADPRFSFAEQNDAVQKLAGTDLAQYWPAYQRNYKLMRIARKLEHAGVEIESWNTLMHIVTGPLPERNYRAMTQVLAQWELIDALSNRTFIYSLARIETPGVELPLG